MKQREPLKVGDRVRVYGWVQMHHSPYIPRAGGPATVKYVEDDLFIHIQFDDCLVHYSCDTRQCRRFNKKEKKKKEFTFKDLVFKQATDFYGVQAKCFFPNGYGVSVIRGKHDEKSERYFSFTENDAEWELAVLKGNESDSHLCYDTPISADCVVGYLSEDGVTELMKEVQALQKEGTR